MLRTIPVGSAGNEPQELNSELRWDRRVFATGVLTNRTFVFDMGDPEKGGLIHVDQPKGGRTLGTPLGVASIPGGRAVVACADRLGYQGDPREVLGAPGGLLVLGNDGRFVGEKLGAGPAARAFIVAPSGVAVRQSMQMVVTASEGTASLPPTRANSCPASRCRCGRFPTWASGRPSCSTPVPAARRTWAR